LAQYRDSKIEEGMLGNTKLYSYIVTHDTGFAPNPFWGCCTLANCKPAIRRTAAIGDWIVGLSPKASNNRIIYVMRVDEILSYGHYYRDPRFRLKIPDYSKSAVISKCGDNIYKPLPNGAFRQIQSMHSNGICENPTKKNRDLGGKNVLISKTFYYFGSGALQLPKKFEELIVGRSHKCRFSSELANAFIAFIADHIAGVNGPPFVWPPSDDSWIGSNHEDHSKSKGI
jgi:hypothetical protein